MFKIPIEQGVYVQRITRDPAASHKLYQSKKLKKFRPQTSRSGYPSSKNGEMRIAVLADRLIMGGLETHIITLTNALLQRGHRILLNAAYANPEILQKITAAPDRFYYRPWSDDSCQDVAWFEPELIHAHPFTAIFRGYEVAHTLSKPMVVTMHGLYDFGLDHSPLGEKISAYVQTVMAVDFGVAALLKKSISQPQKIEVIYNGIDLLTFSPHFNKRPVDLDDFRLNSDWKTVVIVSRMSDGKEQPIRQMLECASSLANHLNGLNLIIVGSGASYTELQAKAEAVASYNPLLQVIMAGEQSDVYRFLVMADLVLACDRAALEAMACQKAVLGMNAQGFADVIQWQNFGKILLNRSGFQNLSHEMIIAKILELLRNDGKRAYLGKAGLEIVQRYFDIQQIAAKVEQIYHCAAEKKSDAPV